MLLLLDIDGVLVPAKSWTSPELHSDGFLVFSQKAITVLQEIIDEDDIIVLTSSHKANYSIEEWKGVFKRRGIKIKNLKCLPANESMISRKDEIINWLKENDIDGNFIIIDDDKSLNDLPPTFKSRLIQTDALIGLTPTHINAIMRLKE